MHRENTKIKNGMVPPIRAWCTTCQKSHASHAECWARQGNPHLKTAHSTQTHTMISYGTTDCMVLLWVLLYLWETTAMLWSTLRCARNAAFLLYGHVIYLRLARCIHVVQLPVRVVLSYLLCNPIGVLRRSGWCWSDRVRAAAVQQQNTSSIVVFAGEGQSTTRLPAECCNLQVGGGINGKIINRTRRITASSYSIVYSSTASSRVLARLDCSVCMINDNGWCCANTYSLLLSVESSRLRWMGSHLLEHCSKALSSFNSA